MEYLGQYGYAFWKASHISLLTHRIWKSQFSFILNNKLSQHTNNLCNWWDENYFSLLFKILFIFLKFIYLFGCAVSFLLHWLFSICVEQGLLSSCCVRASLCDGSYCFRPQVLGLTGFSSCSTWAQWLGLPGWRAQAQ